MKNLSKKDWAFIIFAILVTIVPLLLLPYPGFTEPPNDSWIPFTPKYIAIFMIFNLVFVGLPAWINTVYIKDFTKAKGWLFFTVFGTILSVLLGEGGNLVMLIPYGIITAVYAYSYRKFTWWKVALMALFSGVLMENIVNRAPLQAPTLMWMGFMIYPYFWTKIAENWRKLPVKQMLRDLKGFFIATLILEGFLILISGGNLNIPLLILGPIITMSGHVVISFIKAIKQYRKGKLVLQTNNEDDKFRDLIPLFIVGAIFGIFIYLVSAMVQK